ncbi:ShlB/FhaC/HecB family hemolysin secretion/activation protein [Tatumella ptyseos]|uniref:ShlB/FhaC/HecB family hemolysin secretion/activation protein n=1 Tax=Tatumella ptyseos TaxID=82987 RepID=UPI0026F1FDA5|nr:ShlB/FhaC/HecB family hemolysin secretion/activation protein [Tatumella ptyseos]WKX27201.1 ShlB/FhaC/HecB family hemolysin secretion/activation protein [Tatumella ptyseos]
MVDYFTFPRHLLLPVLGLLCFLGQSQASSEPLWREASSTSRQVSTPPPRDDLQRIHQQAQQRALEQRLAPEQPTIHLDVPTTPSPQSGFPQEIPCFPIGQVSLSGSEAIPHWVPLQRLATTAVGQCLGGTGINLLMRRLQNLLVDHGYVTTRVLASQQDLTTGQLSLTIVPGKLKQLIATAASTRAVTLSNAFPTRTGELLDLRGLEQGLENLQRLPTVQASMEIVPTERPGESDIVVNWQQSRKWRLGVSLDDSGTRSTGRYQGGTTLYLDNPLSFSDSLYLYAGRSLLPGGGKGTHNYTGQYSLPYGYWLASLTASYSDYSQTIAGANADYRYRGQSHQLALQLGRVIHRGSQHKTRLTGEVALRESRNFIDNTAIDAQHRKTTSWKASLQHQQFIDRAVLNLGVSYQQGTRWFGALTASEETFGDATALSRILQLSADIAFPFTLASQQFRYQLQYQQQFTSTKLTPSEQFSIGSRWTVRGFDGERSLNADQGALLRNEWSWFTPFSAQQLYLGIDYGLLNGKGSPQQLGRYLVGSIVGVRGQLLSTGYETFIGVPLAAPQGFMKDSFTLGFSLNWQY